MIIWIKLFRGDIELNDQYSITVKEFPFLKELVGKEIITTDGTTLLGADDKAGIAAIVDAMEYLIVNPEIKHGDIKIGFIPTESMKLASQLIVKIVEDNAK